MTSFEHCLLFRENHIRIPVKIDTSGLDVSPKTRANKSTIPGRRYGVRDQHHQGRVMSSTDNQLMGGADLLFVGHFPPPPAHSEPPDSQMQSRIALKTSSTKHRNYRAITDFSASAKRRTDAHIVLPKILDFDSQTPSNPVYSPLASLLRSNRFPYPGDSFASSHPPHP